MLALAVALAALSFQEASSKPQGTASSPQAATARASADAQTETRLDEVRVLAEQARAALDARKLEEARAWVSDAMKLLDRDPPLELDEDGVGIVVDLAHAAWNAQSIELANQAWTRVLETRERTLPEDHPELLAARANLAATTFRMGDLAGARALQEAVLAAYERTLPEDHPGLLMARGNLAATTFRMGDLAGARALQEAVLAAYERTLPEDHPDLLNARANLASITLEMDDLAGARALQEAVLAAYERTLPEDHPLLLMARANLAATMFRMGDLAGARALEEAVLAARERMLPEDHTDLLMARGNLALTTMGMGDLAGARALQEAVLAARERTLPEDHPLLLTARANLAVMALEMGDLAGARALQEAVLAARERTLPEDHPLLLVARANLAVTTSEMGDDAGARALEEAVLAARERTLPEDHPRLLVARANLAATMFRMGDLAGARALQEAVLAARERTLPEDHPYLLNARAHFTGTLAGLEAWDEVAAQTAALTRGITELFAIGLARSSRAAGESARAGADRLFRVLFLTSRLDAPGSHGSLARAAFEALETARHVSTAGGVGLEDEGADAELERLRWQASRLRGRLNDLLAAEGSLESGEDVSSLVLERDRVDARLRKRLLESGAFLERIDAEALAVSLPESSAAVGYRRYKRFSIDPARRHEWGYVDSLLAHVLRKDGRLQRVEVGPIDEIDVLVEAWRAALGKPLVRGMALEKPGDGAERAAARALAERVLAPVLAAAGTNVETLFVCLDDALHLVPLDALPMPGDEDGEVLVGDVLDLRSEVSFARLIRPRAKSDGEPALVALGGASFNAEPGRVERQDAKEDPDRAPDGVEPAAERAGPGGQMFGPLRQTQFEAENLGLLFEEIFQCEPVVLMNKAAAKDALAEAARGARWLHIATHGYFAPESIQSTADPRRKGALWHPMSAQERVTGLAPMTLCGLALAGANRGRDSLGRVPGILTAEELAGWNLSNCELAVLSACETNVGITRAGQGLQSLQAALHAAGARASITSLWKVDDELTRKLMEDFYTRLWVNGEPKAEALWSAKMALHKQGARTRDWAGWVLVGDPD